MTYLPLRRNFRRFPRDPHSGMDRTIERVEAREERREAERNKRDAPPAPSPSEGPTAQSWPDAASLPDLSEHQREQYTCAARGSIGILGGRPGTGKTYTLARILACVPRNRCAVVAPTGKAAVRITESLSRAGVSGIRATTIHSLLKVADSDENGFSFEYNETNHLPLDWIFVDEFSMCSTSLTGHLLAARAAGARVMMIGDVHQLAPVEHGAPLRDLKGMLPYGELSEIQRNAGRIVKACHAIIDRKTYEPSPKLDLAAESPENLLHVERSDPEQQIETLKGMLEKFRLGAKIAGQTMDPVWDTQILTPLNDKGPLCRKRLNGILQSHLNPSGEQIAGSVFRVNDKICCTSNGFVPVEPNIPPKLDGGPFNEVQKENRVYTANGELAKVLAIFPRYTVARLWLPDRVIRIPKGNSFANENGEVEESGCNWDLAYALSFHRSQGSEWPVVICLADAYPGARMLATREFWYTGISRARTMAVTLGEREVIEAAIRKSGLSQRKTFLPETIRDLQQAGLSNAWEKELGEV